MVPTPQQCAAELLEVVPQIMTALRIEVRDHHATELTVPQFRALAYLDRHVGAALTEVATFLGLTLPTASKMIESLVDSGLVTRTADQRDRRKIQLQLSPAGQQTHHAVLETAEHLLVNKLEPLNADQLGHVSAALSLLKPLFKPHAGEVLNSLQEPLAG